MFDRVVHPARGRAGGGSGAPGRVELADGTALRSKGRQPVPPGARLRLSLPGGGGHGDPALRDPDALRCDLEAGFVTADEAARLYGTSAGAGANGGTGDGAGAGSGGGTGAETEDHSGSERET
jgi:N-methylhydantoinase B/oxoprolinase/acetone carboxylase alpha subunit